VAWVARCHHVFGVKHLLHQFGDGKCTVLLAAAGRERREPGDEEMQTRERHHVDGQLSEVGVELPGEPEARGYAAHGRRHQVVQVTVSGRGEL